jgi:hypothetical protein
VRAALQKALPVVNLFEEAAYWTATRDSAGATLTGDHAYRISFPAGELPPTDAFWSLTATDSVGYLVGNSAGPSSTGSTSDLAKNPDGSVEIVLGPTRPAGARQNWVATPSGRFKLMLRAYLPGAAIVDGQYRVPPVVRVES